MANNLTDLTTARIKYGTDVLAYFKMNLFFGKTVSRKYSQQAQPLYGIVRVPKLTTPSVVKRTKESGVTWGDSSAGYVDVTLDSHAIVPMKIDSLDVIISDVDFRRQMAMQAAAKLAEQVETDLGALYFAVPNFAGAVATTAWADTAKARAANRILDEEKAPKMPRFGALSPAGKDAALGLAQFTQFNTAGDASTLVSGSLGVRFGIDWEMSNGVPTHTGGGTQWAGAVIDGGPYAIGATTIHIDTLTAATAALKKGDSFKVGSYYYSLAADATAASNEVDLLLAQPLRAAVADNDAVTTGEGVKTGVVHMVYLPEAFALATAPILDASERAGTQTSLMVDDDTGLSITVTSSWDHTNFRHLFSTEVLYGVKVVRPEAAVRLLASE